MIQINLIPDVKRDLLRAQALRNLIIFISMVVSIGAAAIVVISLSVAGAQQFMIDAKKKETKEKFTELSQVKDINATIVLQSQLNEISKIRNATPNTSRLLKTIMMPMLIKDITYSSIQYDPETRTVTAEGQSSSGWSALESFQKTIKNTEVVYNKEKNKECSYSDAENGKDGCDKGLLAEGGIVNIVEHASSENEEGQLIMRFKISFVLNEESLKFSTKYFGVKTPNRKEVTDSALTIPSDIFTTNVKAEGEQ